LKVVENVPVELYSLEISGLMFYKFELEQT